MNEDKNLLFQKLKNNLSLSPGQLNKLDEKLNSSEETVLDESSYKKAFDYSIRILSSRDYSIHKMKQKLSLRKFSPQDINQVIEKLIKLNYLREEEYTCSRIKQLVTKGYANKYIHQKLSQEFLESSSEQIETIRNEQNLSSDNQLNKLIEKRLRYKEIPNDFEEKMKLKNKVISFLVSKGYNFDEIQTALGKYFS